jgi:hypothetical protein
MELLTSINRCRAGPFALARLDWSALGSRFTRLDVIRDVPDSQVGSREGVLDPLGDFVPATDRWHGVVRRRQL